MICDCQRNLFDCEEKVRLFSGKAGSLNLAAHDELIARMTPLVEKMVGSKLQGKWRQDRANVVQDTFLKLCDPAKLRTWLESPRRTWFCHWAVVVAHHCSVNWMRRASAPAGMRRCGGQGRRPENVPRTARAGEGTASGDQFRLGGVRPGMATGLLHEVFLPRSIHLRHRAGLPHIRGNRLLSAPQDEGIHCSPLRLACFAGGVQGRTRGDSTSA